MKCNQCSADFIPSNGEIEILKKFDFPFSENCPDCRQKRRQIFRNDRSLFKNVSCVSGKSVVSVYPPTSPFKIVDKDEWWSDANDATKYGRDFDFNCGFFEQFRELQLEVPRWARMFVECENSDYTNNSLGLKDCYLTFSSYQSEHLYYCMRVISSSHCVDCINLRESEFCSNSVECKNCYNVHFSQMAEVCSDSFYLYDCRNCSDCLLCAKLRNKKYMILNKQYSKEDYMKLKEIFFKKLNQDKEGIEITFENLKKDVLHQALRIRNCENSIGDALNDSKNVQNSFYVSESEDCENNYDCHGNKNCYDNLANEKSEFTYECDTAYGLYDAAFCSYTVNGKNLRYTDQCINVKDCFGCVGLHNEEYVILNKKYSPEEYEKMVVKIEEHMRDTGEYGKPFPAELTSFSFKDEQSSEQVTGKEYKIIPQEQKFYEKFRVPVPTVSPEERYKQLSALMRPRKLLDSSCSVCGKDVKTVYPKECGYKVACGECYLVSR